MGKIQPENVIKTMKSGRKKLWISVAVLFLLLLVGILLLLFQYSIVISMHHERILRLTQEIALLKEKLNRTEKTNEPSDQ